MVQLMTYKYNDGNIIDGIRTNTITLDTNKCSVDYITRLFKQHFSTFELVGVEDLIPNSCSEDSTIVLSYKYTEPYIPHPCKPVENKYITSTELLSGVEELHEVLGRYMFDLANFEILSINKI